MRKKLFINYCLKFVGIPYKWGGDDTIDGFDCSGGVQEILSAFGCDPVGDQTADALYRHFTQPGKATQKQVIGALCFYGSKTKIKHVGIALDDYVMFEFGGGGPRVKTKEDASLYNAYGRVRPIDSRRDFICACIPNKLEEYFKGE
jgi:cell wall-associated NlpC family hydrolase